MSCDLFVIKKPHYWNESKSLLCSFCFSFPQKKREIKLNKTAKSDKTQEDKEVACSEKCMFN